MSASSQPHTCLGSSPGKETLPEGGAEWTHMSFPTLTGWLPARARAYASHRCPSQGLSLSTLVIYSSIFLEHWDYKCNPDVSCVPLHLGDVAVIGLDLSQSHELGRPQSLPPDFCRAQSPTGPKFPVHRKPTHSGHGPSLVDFTDDLGSFSGFSPPNKISLFLCLKQSS